jgi:riboflavin biosynthesis pyrimidine reductase
MTEDRFPAQRLALQRIYTGSRWKEYSEELLACSKVESVYGPFRFPRLAGSRSYTFGSFVASIDGRIAFPQSPDGTLIAKSNSLDPDGGLCDFWILNLLRAACDAVIMGARTILREPELTGRVFDQELRDQRILEGRGEVPFHVVVSGSGKSLPLDHKIFTMKEIPSMIVLSPNAAARVSCEHPGCFTHIEAVTGAVTGKDDLSHLPEDLKAYAMEHPSRPLMIGAGEGDQLNPALLVALLAKGGLGRVLVESPTFLAALMAENVLDELFLNTSALFVGGKALTIGENLPAFSPEKHPQASVVTIHAHSDSFFYTRYRFT